MKTLLIIVVVFLVLSLLYAVQPVYRKIFIKNLLSQIRYLVPRYFT